LREQQVHLSFEPEVGAVVPAFGAMTVFTGVIAVADLLTLAAKIDLAAHRLRATVFDILHGL
jgi:hypothetical protein